MKYLIPIICFLTGVSLEAHEPLIEKIMVDKNKLYITVNKAFKEEYLTSDFFVEYEPDINLEQFGYAVLSMPFVMNVISLVWISGKTYYVDEMDAELYESLKRIKKVFSTMYPKTTWDGELIVKKVVSHEPRLPADDTKTALLFSGGIDSVSSALGHLDKKQLLITAWGHWDLPLGNQDLWKVRSKKIKDFAEGFSNEATILRSNYTSMLQYLYLAELSPEIPKWRLGAVEGLGWAGLTAPVLLSKGYNILRIASSHTWAYPYPSAASPFIDNNLRYCGLKIMHDQFDMTRLQKVKYIAETYNTLGIKPPFLKICSYEKQQDLNCHNCRKCLTTILCFRALGVDPAPYGLRYSKKIARKIIQAFSEKELNYYTILLAKEIQETLWARVQADQPVDQELVPFLDISFDDAIPFDIKKQTKLDWPTMISLLPSNHGLEIPKGIG